MKGAKNKNNHEQKLSTKTPGGGLRGIKELCRTCLTLSVDLGSRNPLACLSLANSPKVVKLRKGNMALLINPIRGRGIEDKSFSWGCRSTTEGGPNLR